MKLFGLFNGTQSQKKLTNELNEYYAFAEQKPEDIRVHLRIADVLMKLGQKYKAIEEYIHAAESYEANNLFQISAAIYNQILQIDPDQINVYTALADLYCRQGIVGDAIATYEKLARYYYDHGSKDDAMKILEKMVSLDPKSVYVKKKIAKFYSEKKIESSTGTHYVNWELSDPVTSGVNPSELNVSHEGDSFFDLGSALEDEFMTVEEPFQAPEGVDESQVETMPGFDDIFKEIKQHESAQDDAHNSLLHYNLGTAFQKTGRFDEAIDELKISAEDPARALDSYLRLAVCFREKDMFKESLHFLKKGLNSKDLSPEKELSFHYETAVTYKKQGKARKAHKIFKKISKTDSDFREVRSELAEESS